MTDNVHRMGFRWNRSLTGGPGMPEPIRARVASGLSFSIQGGSACDIRVGDPVRWVSTGTITLAQGSEASGGTAETVWGIVVGVKPHYDGTRMVFSEQIPAGTTYGSVLDRQSIALVVPVRGSLWEIDCDDAVTATTEAAYYALIGENCDHVLTTGSEPKSNCMLDISGHGTATAQWQIKDISPSMENQDFAGAYVKLLVEINEGQLAPFSTTGI